MPITTGDLQRNCYDPINYTPRTIATPGAGANVKKFDPYDQVTQSIIHLASKVYNIKFNKMSGGNTYYLPFESDGITSVSLPAQPNPAYNEPIYFHTIRLTACAIIIDSYQPNIAAGYTTPLGGQDTRPRIIIYHANAVTHYQNEVAVTGVNIGQNPIWFPTKAMTTLANYRNVASQAYSGTIASRKVLLKSDYNSGVEREMQRLRNSGCTNIAYGTTTIVAGFYKPGGWRFYYQTWGAFDYDKGTKQVRELNLVGFPKHRVIEFQQFYP